MKPFNLEEAKSGKKVVTRDGREYKFGAHNPEAKYGWTVIGWIDGMVVSHTEEGTYGTPKCDLFMAEEEVWVNVYESHNGKIWVGSSYPSQSDAETLVQGDRPYYRTVITIRLKP